jgi:hypothetical protein
MLKSAAKTIALSIPPIRRHWERLHQLQRRVAFLEGQVKWHYSPQLLHRPMSLLDPEVSVRRVTDQVSYPDDHAIVSRILSAYRLAALGQENLGDSMWNVFFSAKHQELHAVFMRGTLEEAQDVLRNPGKSELQYGFSMLCAGLYDTKAPDEALHEGARQYLDWLLCLAEHIGAVRMYNPEAASGRVIKADDLISKIEQILGISIQIPNPYPSEAGLSTPRGVLTDRVPMSLYQAWKTRKAIEGTERPRVLEIGAGQGLAAYYAWLLGIRDYTIVDIPFSSLSSSYFLMRTLGPDNVCLYGEESLDSEHKIKIMPPKSFFSVEQLYDLILNVDSLTEMDERVADAYLTKIAGQAHQFLSINHETNAHTVREWITRSSAAIYERVPCYIRKGYVEETVRFR